MLCPDGRLGEEPGASDGLELPAAAPTHGQEQLSRGGFPPAFSLPVSWSRLFCSSQPVWMPCRGPVGLGFWYEGGLAFGSPGSRWQGVWLGSIRGAGAVSRASLCSGCAPVPPAAVVNQGCARPVQPEQGGYRGRSQLPASP